jgi:preprotein translocase subunit SecE
LCQTGAACDGPGAVSEAAAASGEEIRVAKAQVDGESTTAVARVGGVFERLTGPLVEYLRDTRAEMRKVTWPTRQEAINLTLLVLAIMVVLAIFLGGLDALFTELLNQLFTLVGG